MFFFEYIHALIYKYILYIKRSQGASLPGYFEKWCCRYSSVPLLLHTLATLSLTQTCIWPSKTGLVSQLGLIASLTRLGCRTIRFGLGRFVLGLTDLGSFDRKNSVTFTRLGEFDSRVNCCVPIKHDFSPFFHRFSLRFWPCLSRVRAVSKGTINQRIREKDLLGKWFCVIAILV